MRYRLSVLWYHLRLGPLFTFLQYLGRGLWGISILGCIALFTAIPLSLLGYVPSKETMQTIFELTVLAVMTAGLILAFSVAQLPSGLPPDKQPRR
jgi:hypothetical protein